MSGDFKQGANHPDLPLARYQFHVWVVSAEGGLVTSVHSTR